MILFVRRLADRKDLDTWLRAFRRIHAQSPDVRGVIVGKGLTRETLRAPAEQIGLGGVVSMLGFVENPYQYMRQADGFLLSSRYEGF